MQFAGKVVLVTGAQQGIGRAMVLEFAAAGADVAHRMAFEKDIGDLGPRCRIDDRKRALAVAHEYAIVVVDRRDLDPVLTQRRGRGDP